MRYKRKQRSIKKLYRALQVSLSRAFRSKVRSAFIDDSGTIKLDVYDINDNRIDIFNIYEKIKKVEKRVNK